MSQMGPKTGDLDLEPEVNLAMKLEKFCVVLCECNNF